MRVLVVVATKYRWYIVSSKLDVFSKTEIDDYPFNKPLGTALVDVAPFLFRKIKQNITNKCFETALLSVMNSKEVFQEAMDICEVPERLRDILWDKLVDYSIDKKDLFAKLSDIEEEDLNWVAPHWVQYGAISLLIGEADRGKSTFTIDMVAQISKGGEIFGQRVDKGNALIISAEDSPTKVIKPRVKSAGGNVENVYALKSSNLPMFPENLVEIGEQILKHDIKFVVIDPILSMFNGDMMKETDVRQALHSLRELAEVFDCAIMIVTHSGKHQHKNPLHNALGSQGFGAIVRNALMIALDEDTQDRYITSIKNNASEKKLSWKFRIESHEGFSAGRIVNLGLTETKAQDIGVTRDTLQAELEKDIRDYVEDKGIIEAKTLSTYFSNDERVSNSMKTFEYARAELVKRKEIIQSKKNVEGKVRTYYTSPEYQKGGVISDRQEEKD